MDRHIARLRNIGIVAHIDAGKTTLTDRILYYTGRTHRLGSVDDGTTVTDWMEQERERGITIVAAAVSTRWRDCLINLIDTPGHIDFTAEVQRCLRVLDGAVVVFDAVHGVQPQSETVWRQADRYRVPRLAFVNKMDRIGASYERTVASIAERLGVEPVCLHLPLGRETSFRGVIDLLEMRAMVWPLGAGTKPEVGTPPREYRAAAEEARGQLVERLAEADDALLARYVSGEALSPEALRAALRRATLANRLFPVLCGSALRNVGIEPLLDAVVDFLPSPWDLGAVHGTDPATGKSVALEPDEAAPLAALAFKIVNDPYMGHLAYVRLYSGTLGPGMALLNATRGRKERAGRVLRMYANQREDVDHLKAGDIGAVLGLNHTYTGDTLCAPERPVVLEPIGFPQPVIRATVEPRTMVDHDRMIEGLRRLADEDPTFQLTLDEDTGQVVLGGMGELQLEVLVERLRREHGVEVRMGRPRVAYKETVSRSVSGVEGRFIRQTGGRGQYGHVVLALRPGKPGSGLRFENKATAVAVPRQFLPAVEQGVREAARSGALAGFEVTDVEVTLEGGSSHPVDSSELAFRTAASLAFREALHQAQPILLEPLGRIEVLVPAEYTGAVLGQLAARRAEIASVEPRPGGLEAIGGRVPLAEMFGYVTELRSMTQGRGLFTLEFEGYAPVDPAIAGLSLRTHGAPRVPPLR